MSRTTFVHTTFVQGSAVLYFDFPNVLWLGGEVGLPIHGYIHGLLDLCFHSNPRIDPRIDPRFSSSSLWKYDITLNQGELLYIPPLMFHSVVSLTNSISLNMWAFSEEMKATEELKKAQLPFKIDDAISLKAASLAKAISIVVAKIFDYTVTGNVQQVPSALHKVYKEFFNRWQRRWSSIVHDPEFECNTHSHCSNVANDGNFQEDAGSNDTCKSDLQLFTRDQFWGAALNPKVLEYTKSIWKVLNVIGQEESRHGMRKPSNTLERFAPTVFVTLFKDIPCCGASG